MNVFPELRKLLPNDTQPGEARARRESGFAPEMTEGMDRSNAPEAAPAALYFFAWETLSENESISSLP
ncbi:MAG: hypothetical protein ABSE99_07875 [Terracidiphilus sp.]|jgi:hypothetical protein